MVTGPASPPGAVLLDAVAGAAFVFVAGKGGVGKTTVAGALALAHARQNAPTLLLSTDPAHSLADLFTAADPSRGRPCDAPLDIEEFDARVYARAWTERVTPDLLALLEAGTYLDREDAGAFLSLSLPGIDEVMAALRLTELAAGSRRVFVDTAPTGHTLRLLDAGATLQSWNDALEAMAAKATAVASAFGGAVARPAAARLIDELAERIAGFRSAVLGASAGVVVTRRGAPVVAETERLTAALDRAGVPVRALVHVGDVAPPCARSPARAVSFHLPWLDRPVIGCAAVEHAAAAIRPMPDAERGGDAHGEAAEARPAHQAAAAVAAPLRASAGSGAAWLDRVPTRILLFAGKGGVGKTTCAAAAALRLARRNPVLLFSTDPAGSLADVLGGETDASHGHGRLLVRQADPAAALAALRGEYEAEAGALFERLGIGGDAALDRRVAESLWNMAPPGIDEIAALAGLLDRNAVDEDAAGESRTLVLDSAPTGHFLRLLQMPALALDWTHALMRVILKYRAAGSLEHIAGGLLRLAAELKALRSALTDTASAGAVVVTLDEPMVRAETARLLDALANADVAVSAVVVNGVAPDARPLKAGAFGDLPVIAAPLQHVSPVGAGALDAFIRQWELVA